MKIHVKGMNTCPQRSQKVQQYIRFLRGNGHQVVSEACDADEILVWTCGFRRDVRDNTLDQLDDYTHRFGDKVVATGCLPRITPTLLAERFGGDTFPWENEAEELERRYGTGAMSLAEAEHIYTKPARCDDAAAFRRSHPDADVIFHDQFLQLMVTEGCPFQCTYCSERLAFPRFRSFPEDKVVAEAIHRMTETGQRDLILIGDCIGEYGRDIGSSLPALIRCLAQVEPRVRVALSNFHPLHLLDSLDEYSRLIADGQIRHLNLPIQSANDRILKRMARGYTKARLHSGFQRLRHLNFTEFDTHVIVGFPGETDDEFRETIDFVLDIRPKHVLLSRYMDCEDAAAFALPDKIADDVIARRSDEACARIIAAGILCNDEGSELIKERLRRLNQSKADGETAP